MLFPQQKFLPEKTELFLKICIPVFGVLFLQWNMGNIFALFWIELIMYWVLTAIRLFFAEKKQSIFKRLGRSLLFLSFLIIVILFLLILLGQFFDGGNELMQPTITRTDLMYILITASIGYLFVHYLKKERPKQSAAAIIKETEYKVGITFGLLLLILLPLSFITTKYFSNYLMIAAIICTKNLVEYLVAIKRNNNWYVGG